MNNKVPSAVGFVLIGLVAIFVLYMLAPDLSVSNVTQGTIQTSQAPDSATESGKVEVKSSGFQDAGVAGWRYLVGEVVNSTTRSVTFVKVTATYYNDAGAVIGTDYAYADDGDGVASGATAPFKLALTDNLSQVSKYKLDVSWN